MLKVSNVYKAFNAGTPNEKVVFEDLSLHIRPHDFVTVIGGNGSGKSTLLNLIAGTYVVDKGKIELNGKDVTNLKEFERAGSIGRVFQDPLMGTCSDLTIQENLSIAKRKGAKRTLRRGLTEAERAEYAKLLEPLGLGLEERLTAKVGLLSGGQRQALTLLMATLVRPELLLLDEHTAALDPKTACKVLDLTQQLVSENQLTTLMITHNMRDALAFGNRLIMMSEGKIVLDISGEEKRNATVKDLLDLFEKSNGEINDQMFLS